MEIVSYFKDNSNYSILINVLSVLMKRLLMQLRISILDKTTHLLSYLFCDKIRSTFYINIYLFYLS